MNKNHDLIDLSLYVKHTTDKGILVDNLDGDGVWLPKSMVEPSEVDSMEAHEFSMPEWLAKNKGLI